MTYTDPKRYKTREHIRNDMFREVARLWQFDENDLAIESFDPLVGMLLGAFSTGLEGVYHELDNSATRIVSRLANLLTPDVFTGPQPAHAVMKTGIVDPQYQVTPQHAFSCNAMAKEFVFSSAGSYTIYKAKLNTVIIQSRIKELGTSPKENFMNETLPMDEVWVGISLDEEIKNFENLIVFMDWRNDPNRIANLGRLSGVRMFSDDTELSLIYGLVNNESMDVARTEIYSGDMTERMVNRYYKSNFFSVSSRSARTGVNIALEKKRYPAALSSLMNPEDLQKYFLQDLFWIKIKFPGAVSPEVLSRITIDINAFPVLNKKIVSQNFELKPLFNVFPVKVEEGDQFFRMSDVETQSGIKLGNVQQFSRENINQYLLRQKGVTRFDEREATEMLSYMVELLRDESAVFKSVGQSEIDTDVEEIRKRIERINQAIKKDNFPNWFVSVKTAEKSGRLTMKYWTTKADEANHIAFGMKLNRDRSNIAFTDEMTVLLTTTQGGSRPLQTDEYMPVFKKAILTRGRLVTFEDYKAACFAEFGDKLKNVEVKKGFSVSEDQYKGLQQTIELTLFPNPLKPLTAEQWLENKKQLDIIFQEQSSGILPIHITVMT